MSNDYRVRERERREGTTLSSDIVGMDGGTLIDETSWKGMAMLPTKGFQMIYGPSIYY